METGKEENNSTIQPYFAKASKSLRQFDNSATGGGFDPEVISAHAQNFSRPRFQSEIKQLVDKLLDKSQITNNK